MGPLACWAWKPCCSTLEVEPRAKRIASDSTSALAIGSGTGSWRTRHLRLKAAWIQEMIEKGEVIAKHQPGLHQPADLLTKPLSGQRIRALLRLWGIADGEPTRSVCPSSTSTTAMTRALVAMVCCMMMLTVEARGATQGSSIDVGLGSGSGLYGTSDDSWWIDTL